jgi:hypothetical protein
LWRLKGNIRCVKVQYLLAGDVGGLVVQGRQFAIGLDNLCRFGRVLFSHKNDRSTDAWECVLNGVEGFQIGIDAGGFKQALDDDGFVLLLGIENLDELFVGSGWGTGFVGSGMRPP